MKKKEELCIFFKILIVLFFLLFIYVGYRYVKEGIKSQNECDSKVISLEKRRKNAKKICPIKSAGTSMNNREIYVLTLEELGIK